MIGIDRLSTQSARQPAYAGGVVALAVAVVLAVVVAAGIGVFQGVPDGVAARSRDGAVLNDAAARPLVVAPGVVAVVEVAACALTVAGNALETYGLEVTPTGLDTLGFDAVVVDPLGVPLPAAVTGAEPPETRADAETWTNSKAAPTAAMDAARTRVLRRDAVMSGTPSGRLLGT